MISFNNPGAAHTFLNSRGTDSFDELSTSDGCSSAEIGSLGDDIGEEVRLGFVVPALASTSPTVETKVTEDDALATGSESL